MTIFFDHQTFSLQSYGGISRYYAELISGINLYSNHKAYLPLLYSNNAYLHEKGIYTKPFFRDRPFSKREAIVYRANKYRTIPIIRKQAYDIFHSTYYDPYFIKHIGRKPYVVTFMDMIHEKFSNQYQELALDNVITNRKRLVAQKADRVIVISQSTKRDVIELLNVDPDKIDVIYLGNSIVSPPSKYQAFVDDGPYLLFVGNRGHYKNFFGLLSAIHTILKDCKLRLVCAGGGQFTEVENAFIHSLKVEKLVEHKYINDDILANLYRGAVAFIFPSYYEGFGIPILEAFACNCPCIVSNSSSLPEVAGEAALYMDPTDLNSMANAVMTMINNYSLREAFIKKGKEQLAKFSWNKTVEETLSVYQAVLGN